MIILKSLVKGQRLGTIWGDLLREDRPIYLGALAQLVERLHGMQEVSGSNPLCSTKFLAANCFRRRFWERMESGFRPIRPLTP